MSIADKVAMASSRRGYRITRFLILLGATALLTLVLMALSNLSGGYAVGTDPDQQTSALARALDRMSLPIILHLATVIPALPLGIYLLVRQKGDALHKMLGRIWTALMFSTAIISLFIGRPGAGFGGSGYSFIHIFSIVVIISVPLSIWRIRNGDVRGHQGSMQGVFIGLVLAGLFAFLPGRILGLLAFG